MKKNLLLLLVLLISVQTLLPNNESTFHRYLWANYNHFSGNLNSAQDWYKTLFSSNCSLYTYKGYLNFLLDTKQHARIVELIPSLEKKFEHDPEIQLIFVLALEKNNRTTQSDDRLIAISSRFKTHAEIALRATQTYIKRKELENALLTIKTFLNNSPRRPNNFVFYYLEAQINLQLNNPTQALTSITACLDMHPHFDKGWLLQATLNEQRGALQEAITGYNTFLEISGNNPAIEKHLASLVLRHKKTLTQSPFSKSYFDQALSLYEKKEYTTALSHLTTYLKQHPNSEEAQLLHIKITAQLNQLDKLLVISSQFIAQQPKNSPAAPQTLYLLAYTDISPEKVITLLQQLTHHYPDNYWLSLYAADLYLRNNKTSDAIPLLEKALQSSPDQKLNAKIYCQLSLIDYEKGDHAKMLTHLEQGYKLDNNQPHINNMLAYYWATTGKDRIKAETFMHKALAKDKNNPYFLDTHALILYKQKKYDQAQTILEQLHTNHTATSLLHLAKVHYKLDNKKEANLYAQQAASLKNNTHDQKTLHKLHRLLATND